MHAGLKRINVSIFDGCLLTAIALTAKKLFRNYSTTYLADLYGK